MLLKLFDGICVSVLHRGKLDGMIGRRLIRKEELGWKWIEPEDGKGRIGIRLEEG